jgi:H/ACA ribonucleoprotein complex subunit 2
MVKTSVIAHPRANPKVTKKIFKIVSYCAQQKLIRRGVKEVVKSIRKGKRGFLFYFYLYSSFTLNYLVDYV